MNLNLFSAVQFSFFKMLRNCKVARVLPRIADCAKNDKNAVLRARFAFKFCWKDCVTLSICEPVTEFL